jgi:hypothetical protein
LNIPPLKRILSIIIDVETRWNSTFNMLERFLILRRCIQAVMAQHDKSFDPSMSLHADEWNRMDVLWRLLYFPAELTVRVQAEKFPSRGRTAWDYRMLLKIFSRIREESLSSSLCQEVSLIEIMSFYYVIIMFSKFFKVLRSNLTARFPEFEVDAIKALILDPRLKPGRHRFPAQIERAVEQITEEAALINVAVAEPAKKVARKETIWDAELTPITSSRTVGAAKSEGAYSRIVVMLIMILKKGFL